MKEKLSIFAWGLIFADENYLKKKKKWKNVIEVLRKSWKLDANGLALQKKCIETGLNIWRIVYALCYGTLLLPDRDRTLTWPGETHMEVLTRTFTLTHMCRSKGECAMQSRGKFHMGLVRKSAKSRGLLCSCMDGDKRSKRKGIIGGEVRQN